MSRRTQLVLLGVLIVILAAMAYFNWNRQPEVATVATADEAFRPSKVESPVLRLDLIDRIRKMDYTGRRRNIFSAGAPLPVPPPVDPNKPAPGSTPPPVALGPAPPPPLQVPAKFFGYAFYPQAGVRRAFFTNGEDVFIVGEGETLLGHFRLLRISNTTAEFEEIGSGQRATLVLEEQGPPPA